MSTNNKEKNINENKKIEEDGSLDEAKSSDNKNEEKVIEKTVEEKLRDAEEKLLRSLAEIENQRRRFEKEIKDAFEFGSYNFAKESLAIPDNLQRAKQAIKNDEKLKDNKDLEKFL
jgi:molecular chaperone GrpE